MDDNTILLKTVKKGINDKRVKYAVANVLNLPFADKSFDTVCAWDVIEHIEKGKEELMFTEVSRVLKGGGVFYLSCPCKSLISVIFDPAWWFANHRHYSLRQLAALGKSSNLVFDRAMVCGKFWELIFLLNLYFSKWILKSKPVFEEFVNKKADKDFGGRGFMHIFVKLKKYSQLLIKMTS